MRVYYRRLLLSLGVMLWSLSLSSPPLFSSTLSLLPSFFHSYILFLYPLLFCFCLYHCNFPFIERVPITTTAYYLLSAWLSFLLLWEFTPRSIGHNILASLVSLILRVSCSLSGYYLFDLLHPRPVVPGLTIARGWPGPILFLQVGGILRLTAFFFFLFLPFIFFSFSFLVVLDLSCHACLSYSSSRSSMVIHIYPWKSCATGPFPPPSPNPRPRFCVCASISAFILQSSFCLSHHLFFDISN